MSVIKPGEARQTWRPQGAEPAVYLYLDADGDAVAQLAGARVAGYELALIPVTASDWIDAAALAGAATAVVQVDADSQASMKRFERLVGATTTPLIAATYDPPLAFVRQLIRIGAHDVIPLPLEMPELETTLTAIRAHADQAQRGGGQATGKLVSIIKSVGGVGATALLTQLATRFAVAEGSHGREACLIDLDVQFGNAAFYLNMRPKLSLMDLIEAGSRIDGAMLRATAASHSSGLSLIGPPPDMIPLESLNNDQLIGIIDLAKREFGTVFVDLPTNWTNWSLSLVARSDIVLLVTEMNVSGLQRARRQLDLIAAQDLGPIDIRVVANRYEKSLFRTIRPGDVREVLGHDISYTIANDYAVMSAAIDQGVPIEEIRRKSSLARDLQALDVGLAAALRLER